MRSFKTTSSLRRGSMLLLFLVAIGLGAVSERSTAALVKKTPSVELKASATSINSPCPLFEEPTCNVNGNMEVRLAASIKHFGKRPIYTYAVTGGRLQGEGREVTWDLRGVQVGAYTASVEVVDEKGRKAYASTTVIVQECPRCIPLCPTVNMSCIDSVREGDLAAYSVGVQGNGHVRRVYNWTVSAGTIVQGQGTPSITVATTGLAGQSVTATVELSGFAPECQTAASCTLSVHK